MTRSARPRFGAGDDGVPVPDQSEAAGCCRSAAFDGVGQLAFVPGHAVDVDQRGGQQGHVLAQVKGTGAVSAITIRLYSGTLPGRASSIDWGHD